MIPGRTTEREYRAIGKIWPNGEFSLGYIPEGEDVDAYGKDYLSGTFQQVDGDIIDALLQDRDLWEDELWAADSLHGLPCTEPLTLSDALNSHSPPPRASYGLQGLTAYGRRMIRSGCYLLEERLGKEDCVMVTLTVPAVPRESRRALALSWGVLTNRLLQYLSRELLKQGRGAAIIGCVEVQTGRLKKYSEGYLHLHLVCPAHSNNGRLWAIQAGDLRTWWSSALERIVGHSLPHLPRVETAIVEKSVEAYLSKYLSKGSGEDLSAFVDDLGEECVPGQWWFCSSPMRSAIKENTLVGGNCGALLDSLVQHLLSEGTGDGFEYIRHVDRLVGGKLVTCGWVGRVGPELREELKSMLGP
jgi:hypothetical protein